MHSLENCPKINFPNQKEKTQFKNINTIAKFKIKNVLHDHLISSFWGKVKEIIKRENSKKKQLEMVFPARGNFFTRVKLESVTYKRHNGLPATIFLLS